jgi:predicted DNA-binding transcriptional regulator AlpA
MTTRKATVNEAQILYVPQLAAILGRTEAAIRSAVNRGADWLPPSFPMGRRLAWRREDVDSFLAQQAKKGGR